MSLLMDALNKAEQAKRQSQATDGRPDGADQPEPSSPPLTLELTPLAMPEAPPAVAATPAPPPPLPELPTHLGVLDEEFIAHATAPKPVVKKKEPPPPMIEARPAPQPDPAPVARPTPAPAPAPARKAEPEEREAAKNLFDAKQGANPPSRRRLAIVIGVLTLLAGTGIGVYVWLQMQPGGGLGAARPGLAGTPRPPLQPPPTPAAAPAAVPPAAPAVAAQPAPLPARPTNQDPVTSGPAEQAKPIRLSASRVAINPAVLRGYDAYIAGNLAEAQNEYQQVLKAEPANLDALHGMAAISLRQGRTTTAEEYYLRAIEADPKDALAHAGLIGLKGKVDPLQAESRLKTLLASQPDLPYLNFALGNLYASQNRWDEAQSAYFKAYAGEPENPDTLFNLAISLDRLHQSKLAYHYYSLALVAAENRPASFDKAQINARLRELQ